MVINDDERFGNDRSIQLTNLWASTIEKGNVCPYGNLYESKLTEERFNCELLQT